MSSRGSLESTYAASRTSASGVLTAGARKDRDADRRPQDRPTDKAPTTELEPHWSASIDGATD